MVFSEGSYMHVYDRCRQLYRQVLSELMIEPSVVGTAKHISKLCVHDFVHSDAHISGEIPVYLLYVKIVSAEQTRSMHGICVTPMILESFCNLSQFQALQTASSES